MQIIAIGTVWRCEENPNYQDDGTEQYTVDLVEYLPGHAGKEGPKGQAMKLSLESGSPLQEGIAYRVIARVTRILPTREDDDLAAFGTVIEATQIE